MRETDFKSIKNLIPNMKAMQTNFQTITLEVSSNIFRYNVNFNLFSPF